MKLYSSEILKTYLEKDDLLEVISAFRESSDEVLTCQKWLLGSSPKRMIFWDLYGDFLQDGAIPKRILDIGGGLTSLTRLMVQKHHYELVDVMAHDSPEDVDRMLKSVGASIWREKDWWAFEPKGVYDVVVANDLFPNVDQRLDLFISRMLTCAREIRLSLTFYPEPRFYSVKRVEADELMCLLAWDHLQLGAVLEKYKHRILGAETLPISNFPASLFPNGRQVASVTINGVR